jgi:hypothetical protein
MSVDKRIICRFVDPDELVPVGEAPTEVRLILSKTVCRQEAHIYY